MRLAMLCTNRQRCCHHLHMAVRLTSAVDLVQVQVRKVNKFLGYVAICVQLYCRWSYV
jgi:hypothetical protein